MSNIPSGRVTISGIILDSGMDAVDPNKIVTTVLTKDPYTGESVRLNNVVLKQSASAAPDTIAEDQPVTITAASYDAYRRKNIAAMSASVAPTAVPALNTALPDQVKVKSKIDAFSSRPSTMCKAFQDKVDDLNERMGMVYKRTDLTIIKGKDSGASPTMIIHQGNGDILMSDGNGKQTITLNGQNGIMMNAGQVNTGSAMKSKNSIAYGGMSGYDNPVSEVLPQGTIFTPHPKLLPNITLILNTIIPIMDMIDLGKACMEAYKLIYTATTDEDKKESSERIKELEENNTTADLEKRTQAKAPESGWGASK